jgi:hypothetical protein
MIRSLFNKRDNSATRLTTRTSNSFRYEDLEARRVLAATIYVDFGLGQGDLEVSNADVVDIGGPQFFGLGHTLTSFEAKVASTEYDLNFDEMNDASDAADFAAEVLKNLNEIFSPFDVEIVATNESDFDNVKSLFEQSDSNDAYIFVRGKKPFSNLDFGASNVDSGNQVDSTGFVFVDDMFDFWRANFNQPGPISYDIAPALSWGVARQIAKQAGHGFGLQAIEAINGQGSLALQAIMRQPGTAANRDFFEARPGVFAQFDFPLRTVNGVSNGTQDSFAILEETLGLRPDSPYYVTTNPSANELIVTPGANGSLTFSAGDRTLNPTVAELENGIVVAGGFGMRLKMGQLSNFDFEVRNSGIQVDPSLDHTVSDPSELPTNFFRSRLSIDPVAAWHYFGTINDNITYTNSTSLSGGDGKDVFRFFEPEINVELENPLDVFTFLENPRPSRDRADGMDGNNVFIMDRTVDRISSGSGIDFFRGTYPMQLFAGDGYDILETTEDFAFHSFREGNVVTQRFVPSAVNRLVGLDRIVNTTNQGTVLNFQNTVDNPILPVSWIINGDRAVVYESTNNARLDLIGFTGIVGKERDAVFVRTTTNDWTITDVGYVQLSSEFNPQLGHTDNINHRITLTGETEFANVVIGARAGSGVQALFTSNFLSGVTGNQVLFEDGYQPSITVHGSDSSPDYIAIASSLSSINLFGNGGDDIFTLGYAFAGDASLERLQGFTTIDGGAGEDFVIANDSNVDPGHLRISNRYLHKTPVAGFETNAGIVRYDGIEQFRINVDFTKNTLDDYFASIFRSHLTQYYYNLNLQTTEGFRPTNDLVLIGTNPNEASTFTVAPNTSSPPEPASIRGGTWTFTAPLKPIVIARVNTDIR